MFSTLSSLFNYNYEQNTKIVSDIYTDMGKFILGKGFSKYLPIRN